MRHSVPESDILALFLEAIGIKCCANVPVGNFPKAPEWTGCCIAMELRMVRL
jgi:hypothetical protein